MAFSVLANRGAEIKVIDGTGGTRDLTAFYLGGFPELANDVVDVSSIADAAHRVILGLQNNDASVQWLFDDGAAPTGSWAVLSSRLGEATAHNVIFYPAGTASGKPIITVPYRMTTCTPGGGVGEAAKIETNFATDGTRTVGTV